MGTKNYLEEKIYEEAIRDINYWVEVSIYKNGKILTSSNIKNPKNNDYTSKGWLDEKEVGKKVLFGNKIDWADFKFNIKTKEVKDFKGKMTLNTDEINELGLKHDGEANDKWEYRMNQDSNGFNYRIVNEYDGRGYNSPKLERIVDFPEDFIDFVEKSITNTQIEYDKIMKENEAIFMKQINRNSFILTIKDSFYGVGLYNVLLNGVWYKDVEDYQTYDRGSIFAGSSGWDMTLRFVELKIDGIWHYFEDGVKYFENEKRMQHAKMANKGFEGYFYYYNEEAEEDFKCELWKWDEKLNASESLSFHENYISMYKNRFSRGDDIQEKSYVNSNGKFIHIKGKKIHIAGENKYVVKNLEKNEDGTNNVEYIVDEDLNRIHEEFNGKYKVTFEKDIIIVENQIFDVDEDWRSHIETEVHFKGKNIMPEDLKESAHGAYVSYEDGKIYFNSYNKEKNTIDLSKVN